MPNLNHRDPDERKITLSNEARVIEGKLEGLYRQLYQACTQQALTPSFRTNRALMNSANILFADLERIVETYEQMVADEMKEKLEEDISII